MQVILQHRHLLELVRKLEESVACNVRVDWRPAVESLLAELIELLGNHFAEEVRTTFSDLRALGNSACAEQLAQLDAEHPVLLEQFHEVRRLSLDRRTTRKEVQAALAGAIFAFRRHEARENALFQELL